MHPHFHILFADGIFSTEGKDLLFHKAILTPDDIADTQDAIQRRVLKFFRKRGWFEQDEIEKMLSYENSGFSLDASVCIEAWDRAGLERLIRYCARPPFASENLRLNGPWLTYHLPKPSRTGQICIQLQPLEFIEKIAAFIPYPRRHRRHYHGVFAPSSLVRKKVAANAQKARIQVLLEARETADKVSFNWAKLIARIYETDPLICSSCGKKIKIIAFVIHAAQIRRILSGIGLPTAVPEFDPEYDIVTWDICQLVPDTIDGFAEVEQQIHSEVVPDPPWQYYVESDRPHWEDLRDPPHWVD